MPNKSGDSKWLFRFFDDVDDCDEDDSRLKKFFGNSKSGGWINDDIE